jgi:hypothetical protein
LDQDDFQEMANQFLDPNMFKDDASMTSSMDDSTYMSQPDTGRQQGLRAPSRNQHTVQRQPDVFPNQLFSPALSTSSHGGYPGAQSDMNSLFLSSNATETDFGESAFSEFANFPAQGLNQNTYQLPSSSRQADDSHSGWIADSQNFSRPFAVSSVDAISAQNDLSAREFMKPSFAQYAHASQTEAQAGGFMGSYVSNAARPQVRRIDTATSTQSKLSRRKSSFSNESEIPQSATTQHSMNFIGPQFIDRSAMPSPASPAVDQKPLLSASTFDEETFK